ELAVGQRLSPAALAREMGISHTPVREALSLLESEGAVEHKPRRGVKVRLPDAKEFLELLDLRVALEEHAAARAARLISGADLERLASQCGAMGAVLRELFDSRA